MEITYQVISERVKSNALAAMASLPFGKYTVSIKKIGKTNPQRAYWHMAVGIIAEHSGYTKEQAKFMIKKAVLGTERWTDKKGNTHEMVPATESLSKEDYSRLIDYTLIAASKIGCVIPSPLEYGLER